VKKAWMFVAALAFATVATAELSKYKDWVKSPEAYFLSAAERTEWSKVSSDDDAEKFIAGYWAKRGGQRFKDEISRRIAAADQQFKLRRQKGAESARGRLLIVLGGPSRVSATRPQEESGATTGDAGLNIRPDAGTPGGQPVSSVIQTWTYLKEKFDPSWGIPELRARINVDAPRGTDELVNRAEVDRVVTIVAEKSIVNPAGTEPPAPAAASSAPAPAAAAPAPGAPAPGAMKPVVPLAGSGPPAGAAPAPAAPAAAVALPAATRALLDSLAKEHPEGTGFWGGNFHSIPGDSFYAVELATSADKAPANTARFAGVVTGDAGQEVASFFEEVPLADAKTGVRTEKVYERSIVLPPGSYKGSFALLGSDGTTPLASGTASFQLAAKSNDFEVSPLVLASILTPLTKRPAPTDPFVFGMEKPIRVDPKASRFFSKDESLWYFYTVTNPALPAAPAAAAAAPAAAPGAAGAPPAAAAAPEVKPRIMTRISVLRDGQPAFAPFSGPAELQILGSGYYATGTEIPLTSFQPGYYTFSINVRDLNAPRDSAANKGFDRKQDFIVLNTDGSVPEKKAAAPAPAAKPKPPKK
jgi:GWxTD domain-containing protein